MRRAGALGDFGLGRGFASGALQVANPSVLREPLVHHMA
jgi:hypothetical protein